MGNITIRHGNDHTFLYSLYRGGVIIPPTEKSAEKIGGMRGSQVRTFYLPAEEGDLLFRNGRGFGMTGEERELLAIAKKGDDAPEHLLAANVVRKEDLERGYWRNPKDSYKATVNGWMDTVLDHPVFLVPVAGRRPGDPSTASASKIVE